ncbi:MAG: lactate utilization protein [Deltaproteobacteria bacterium]|nr:lactate utilization protein [Deltaproteobacteria bacterium]
MHRRRVQRQADDIASPPEWLADKSSWNAVKNELELLGDRFQGAERPQDMRRILGNIVREHTVSLAVRWEHPLLERLGIDRILGELGVKIDIPSREEEWKELSAKAQLGITAVDALIMESGTLVVRASKEWGRSTSLLPPVHVAIVQPDQRLKDVDSLARLCRSWTREPEGLPSAVTLITGHSRTADIELTLVSGVHGPGMVYVIGLSAAYDLGEEDLAGV